MIIEKKKKLQNQKQIEEKVIGISETKIVYTSKQNQEEKKRKKKNSIACFSLRGMGMFAGEIW